MGAFLSLAKPFFSGAGLWFLLGAFAAGAASGGWVTHKFTEARALKAEKELADFKQGLATAIADAAEAQVTIRDDVRTANEQAKATIDAMAGELRRLRRDVRVCAAKSDMPVPTSPAGTGEAAGGGQPRDAVEVLQDLAAFIAKRCDLYAADHNTLIEWLERTRAQPLAK